MGFPFERVAIPLFSGFFNKPFSVAFYLRRLLRVRGESQEVKVWNEGNSSSPFSPLHPLAGGAVEGVDVLHVEEHPDVLAHLRAEMALFLHGEDDSVDIEGDEGV